MSPKEHLMHTTNWSLVENKQRFISQVMTSKAASRSCEDIDEATLSYAEIKAVATGNPLIKEKMEIDNDVQRLKLLKASYDNQRYGLQDNFMIKYPKLIKTATEKLANVREDVKARDKELIDNPEFAITIGKATYTERVDGGTMMLEAISKCKTGETTAIGKFHGFELLVEKNFLDINYMVLRGKTEYKAELSTSPVGSMVKLENLFNGLHENIDFLEKKIEQYQNDLEASKTEYDKPFAYSKELEEKLARQCELNAQLDLENAKAVDADLSGPEEEREADVEKEQTSISKENEAILKEGGVIGIIEIPGLDIRYPVMEGTTSKVLNAGIDHIEETAGIGESGNCVLCGHNGSRYGTFFTPLSRISIGDGVMITDKNGLKHIYEVTETEVVNPYANSIKTQGTEKELTLFTCSQKGTMRFVVRCIYKEAVMDE